MVILLRKYHYYFLPRHVAHQQSYINDWFKYYYLGGEPFNIRLTSSTQAFYYLNVIKTIATHTKLRQYNFFL